MENKTLFVPVCVCLLTSTILVACRPFLAPTSVPPTKMPTPVPPIKTPTPPPTNTSAPMPTIETKTYTDEFADFSINYPADWVVESEPGSYVWFAELSLETIEDVAKEASFRAYLWPGDFDDFQEEYLGSSAERGRESSELESVTVAGTEGVAVSITGAFYGDEVEAQAYVVFAVNGDRSLIFDSVSPADTWEENWPIFEMMLDSLTFLEPVTTEAISPPTEIPEAELTLVGYGYSVRDAGDGWNEGRLSLALENKTDRLAGFSEIQLPPPVIETQEGHTYQGELGFYGIADFVETDSINGAPWIPPNFRIKARTRGEPAAVVFRFAYAAHPTFVMFPGNSRFRIDLSVAAQTNSLGFVGSDSSSIRSITELYDRVLVDEPDEVKVTVKTHK